MTDWHDRAPWSLYGGKDPQSGRNYSVGPEARSDNPGYGLFDLPDRYGFSLNNFLVTLSGNNSEDYHGCEPFVQTVRALKVWFAHMLSGHEPSRRAIRRLVLNYIKFDEEIRRVIFQCVQEELDKTLFTDHPSPAGPSPTTQPQSDSAQV